MRPSVAGYLTDHWNSGLQQLIARKSSELLSLDHSFIIEMNFVENHLGEQVDKRIRDMAIAAMLNEITVKKR